jgi:uncharacterized membrane protein
MRELAAFGQRHPKKLPKFVRRYLLPMAAFAATGAFTFSLKDIDEQEITTISQDELSFVEERPIFR